MRFIRRQGFGIQSPWAYSFVKDVLYEKLRYYAYDDLLVLFPDRRKTEIRRDEQLFRIVNYFRPGRIQVVGSCSDSTVEYMRVANRGAEIIGATVDAAGVSVSSASFVYIGEDTSSDAGCRVVEERISCGGNCWTLVVDGINGRHKRLWQRLLADEDGALTFDMKYRGVAFFDDSRISHNYVV